MNLVLVVPLFFGPSRPESGELRVLSFNVLASNRRFEEVIDFIRATDADVVVLHEVTGRWEEAIEEASRDVRRLALRSHRDPGPGRPVREPGPASSRVQRWSPSGLG